MDHSTKAVAEVVLCPRHTQPLLFTCLDPACNDPPGACVICVKELHPECREEFLLEADRLDELVAFQLDAPRPASDPEVFREIVRRKEEELRASLESAAKAFDALSQGDVNLFDLDEPTLALIKRLYQVREDAGGGRLEVRSNFEAGDKDKFVKNYAEDLAAIAAQFQKELREVQIEIGGALSVAKFKAHESIAVTKKGATVNLKRKSANKEFNYFAAIYTEPLKQSLRLQLTIEGINSGDPFLDVGIFDSTKLGEYLGSNVVSFASGGYSYCGTSSSNLDGSSGNFVFKKGAQFEMLFDRAKGLLEFRSKGGAVSLKTTALNKGEKYYLFLVLYHPEAEVSVKTIAGT